LLLLLLLLLVPKTLLLRARGVMAARGVSLLAAACPAEPANSAGELLGLLTSLGLG
jgi:hypothetical protein